MVDSTLGKNNLYYPVFRSIESEVIALSQGIYFSDEQLKVYSIKISELLSRCLTEIESLYKELYRRENNNDPKNVGEAWRSLNSQWQLDKKELCITSDNFFFNESFNPYFAPFDYRNGSENDFYSAYNGIKHDRAKNLNKANLNVLIRSLGALYILNVYYSDKKITSNIFEAKTAGRTVGVFMDLGLDLSDFMSSCLFIEFLEYNYYFWQEDSSAECKKMINNLSDADKEVVKQHIQDDSSNIFFAFNRLFEAHDATITVGDMLRKTHETAEPLVSGDVEVVVNTGYHRVYLSIDELSVSMSELGNGDKVVALENLKKIQRRNDLHLSTQ